MVSSCGVGDCDDNFLVGVGLVLIRLFIFVCCVYHINNNNNKNNKPNESQQFKKKQKQKKTAGGPPTPGAGADGPRPQEARAGEKVYMCIYMCAFL